MPVTTATSGLLRAKDLTTYEQRRPTSALANAFMLLYAQHGEITDDLDFVRVARNFVDTNDYHKSILD